MKNKISILLVAFFIACGAASTIYAYSASSLNKKILAVQAEVEALEADMADVETESVRKYGERKLKKYRKEIAQLRKDLQITKYREMIRRDRNRLKKHR